LQFDLQFRVKMMTNMKKEIGTRITNLRKGKEKKETQQDLANAISVSKDLISKIEQGKANISIYNAIEIAKHYDVSLDWICGITKDIDDSNI
jgi:transcriptional regulator with XRE-family HTH domain